MCMCLYVCVCVCVCTFTQAFDRLTHAARSGRIVNTWVVLNRWITPGPMLKAALICHVEDKRIVNIPV